LLKVLVVVMGGFYFTLLSTAASVIGVRRLISPPIEQGTTDDADIDDSQSRAIQQEEALPPAPAAATKAFSDETEDGLRATAVFGAIFSIALSRGSSPLKIPITALFLLSTTLHNFVYGSRLPNRIKGTFHPLVTCTALTWAVMKAYGILVGIRFKDILKAYRAGSIGLGSAGGGDFLLFMLGPAVVSLSMSMYEKRKLMKDSFAEVVVATSVSSGGIFATALLGRMLAILSPDLRLALLSRNITSPLAMAMAEILHADVSMAVSIVVLTGLWGANFGARTLSKFGIEDPIARGLGMGAAAHGLGTAAIVDEPDAFPFSAISMALTASACTVMVSIPFLRNIVVRVALGG
jgi:putative effector of murein hydrolase